jgi:hypothetical protein
MTASEATSNSGADAPPLTLEDLMAMSSAELHAVLTRGHALDPDALAGRQFLGVDLSLPGFARKLLWHTFRKTFHRDEEHGDVRGWNVRLEQRGVDAEQVPMTDRAGRPRTFGHYRVRVEERQFPRGTTAPSYLNYGIAGNTWGDLARLGVTPLVAVNPGRQDLLLGWEVFKVWPGQLALPLYWALRLEGPLDEVVAPPRTPRP